MILQTLFRQLELTTAVFKAGLYSALLFVAFSLGTDADANVFHFRPQ